MKTSISIFALVLSAQAFADKPACPTIEAVKAVRVTDAEKEEPYMGTDIWVAKATDNFGTAHSWEMEIAMLGYHKSKDQVIAEGQDAVSNISRLMGEEVASEEYEHWICRYIPKGERPDDIQSHIVILSRKRRC